jgi:hypothetical protein
LPRAGLLLRLIWPSRLATTTCAQPQTPPTRFLAIQLSTRMRRRRPDPREIQLERCAAMDRPPRPSRHSIAAPHDIELMGAGVRRAAASQLYTNTMHSPAAWKLRRSSTVLMQRRPKSCPGGASVYDDCSAVANRDFRPVRRHRCCCPAASCVHAWPFAILKRIASRAYDHRKRAPQSHCTQTVAGLER